MALVLECHLSSKVGANGDSNGHPWPDCWPDEEPTASCGMSPAQPAAAPRHRWYDRCEHAERCGGLRSSTRRPSFGTRPRRSRIDLLSLALARTLRPGASDVPAADALMFLMDSASITMISDARVILRAWYRCQPAAAQSYWPDRSTGARGCSPRSERRS
jgi:hypothetical protein